MKKIIFGMVFSMVLCIGLFSSAQNLCFLNTDIPDFGAMYDIPLDKIKSGNNIYYYNIDNSKNNSKDYTVKEYCTYLENNGFILESKTDASRTYYRFDGSWIEVYSWKSDGRIFAVSEDKEYLLKITAKYDVSYDTKDEEMVLIPDIYGNTINLGISKKEMHISDILDIFADCETKSNLFYTVSDSEILNLIPKKGKCTVTANKTGRVTLTARNAYGAVSTCVIRVIQDEFQESKVLDENEDVITLEFLFQQIKKYLYSKK